MRHSLLATDRSAAILAALFVSVSTVVASDLPRTPGSTVATSSTGDIVEAELIGRTTRYRHFVLGREFESEGLRVRTATGQRLQFLLPADSVFEDLDPRIADLDADGRNEVIVVRSRLTEGSSLAVLGIRGGKLAILAETTTNGGPRRWLDPAGIGDFYGEGSQQIALVRMPHVVGRLEFWDFKNGSLHLRGQIGDTSNHRAGTAAIRGAVVIRRNDGDWLAIPDLARARLRVISAKPSVYEVTSVRLNAPIAGNLTGDGTRIHVPLEGGGEQVVTVSAAR